MEMIDALRTYIANCELLDPYGAVRVDYLTSEPVAYSIDPVPSTNILSTDVTGTTTRQYLFQFASKNAYSDDVQQNMMNSGFFEKFANWLEQNSEAENLPDFGPTRKVTKIYASGLGFILDATESNARYAIQCGIIYEQED